MLFTFYNSYAILYFMPVGLLFFWTKLGCSSNKATLFLCQGHPYDIYTAAISEISIWSFPFYGNVFFPLSPTWLSNLHRKHNWNGVEYYPLLVLIYLFTKNYDFVRNEKSIYMLSITVLSHIFRDNAHTTPMTDVRHAIL